MRSKTGSPMDRTSYFSCRFRLDDADSYLIWYSNGSDGILLDTDGTVPCFGSPSELMRFAESHDIAIEVEEPALHDLNAVEGWVKEGGEDSLDCNQLLRAWNLFTDLSASVKGDFDGDHARTNSTYEKLFQCAAEPDRTDSWSADEIQVLHDTLESGLALFRRYVRGAAVVGA